MASQRGAPLDVLRLLSHGVTDAAGKPVTLDAHVGAPAPAAPADEPVVALYFSAHWCPPCRRFTPVLAGAYRRLRAAGRPVEVVFLSWDETAAEYGHYAGTMPWARLPHKDPRVDALAHALGVRSIPALVAVSARTGAVMNADARSAVQQDPTGGGYPWQPPQRSRL
jgi:nucleoredoxin